MKEWRFKTYVVQLYSIVRYQRAISGYGNDLTVEEF